MTHIHTAWRAGHVKRWHANPDLCEIHDTTAAHSGRMAVLAIQIFPEHAAELLPLIAAHDNAEDVVGDIPQPAKQANPDLDNQIQELEHETLRQRNLPIPDDNPRLKFLDRLDAYKTMRHHKPELAERKDWIKAGQNLENMADELNIYDVFMREVWTY